jgi:hypothetical protein
MGTALGLSLGVTLGLELGSTHWVVWMELSFVGSADHSAAHYARYLEWHLVIQWDF